MHAQNVIKTQGNVMRYLTAGRLVSKPHAPLQLLFPRCRSGPSDRGYVGGLASWSTRPRMEHGRNTDKQTTKDTKHTKVRRRLFSSAVQPLDAPSPHLSFRVFRVFRGSGLPVEALSCLLPTGKTHCLSLRFACDSPCGPPVLFAARRRGTGGRGGSRGKVLAGCPPASLLPPSRLPQPVP